MTDSTLSNEDIEANLAELNKRIAASEFFGVVNKDALLTMFAALKQSRAEIAKLRKQNEIAFRGLGFLHQLSPFATIKERQDTAMQTMKEMENVDE